jgi:peptidoglycan hydrolase CwlO-like protein
VKKSVAAAVAKKIKETKSLEDFVAAKNAEIIRLKSAALPGNIVEKDKAINSLKHGIAAKDEEITRLKSVVGELRSTIAEKDKDIKSVKASLACAENVSKQETDRRIYWEGTASDLRAQVRSLRGSNRRAGGGVRPL